MTLLTCKHGHHLAGENLRVNKRGDRVCRTCAAAHSRRSYERRLQKPLGPCIRCQDTPRQRTGSYCRGCENIYQREWWAGGGNRSDKAERAKEKRREVGQLATFLKSTYGISVADFEAMLEQQSGVCRICGRPPKRHRLVVDHDHATGRVRGLLCQPCNAGIGMLQDDPEVVLKAAAYLSTGAV